MDGEVKPLVFKTNTQLEDPVYLSPLTQDAQDALQAQMNAFHGTNEIKIGKIIRDLNSGAKSELVRKLKASFGKIVTYKVEWYRVKLRGIVLEMVREVERLQKLQDMSEGLFGKDSVPEMEMSKFKELREKSNAIGEIFEGFIKPKGWKWLKLTDDGAEEQRKLYSEKALKVLEDEYEKRIKDVETKVGEIKNWLNTKNRDTKVANKLSADARARLARGSFRGGGERAFELLHGGKVSAKHTEREKIERDIIKQQIRDLCTGSDVSDDTIEYMCELDGVYAMFGELKDEGALGDMWMAKRWKLLTASLEDLRTKMGCEREGCTNARSNLVNIILEIVVGFAYNPDSLKDAHLNMVLMGNPGCGKTSFATHVSHIMSHLGLLLGTKPVDNVSKSELVGQFLGETAMKMNTRLSKCLEGVMFIDEAYALAAGSATSGGKDYGIEAITELVNFVDEHKGRICVIAAGYEDNMRADFLGANRGMPRRFPYQVKLEDYSPSDLLNIFKKFLAEKQAGVSVRRALTPAAETYLRRVLRSEYARAKQQEAAAGESPVGTPALVNNIFSNGAGDVENLATTVAMLSATHKRADITPVDMQLFLSKYCQESRGVACQFPLDLGRTEVYIEEEAAPLSLTSLASTERRASERLRVRVGDVYFGPEAKV